MRFILVFLISVMISVSGIARYTLAVFGDSLSAGHGLSQQDSFYGQLERALKEKGYDIAVLNISKGGETTQGGLRRINTLLAQKPDGVILELGVNDSFRNTPIETIKGNLKNLIETCQNHQMPVLLVGMKTLPIKPIVYQEQFEAMYRDLASTYRLDFYPFFMEGIFDSTIILNQRVQNDNLLANDIHPSAKGVSVMVRGILPIVERFLNKQNVFPR